jgi:hypothetical protein
MCETRSRSATQNAQPMPSAWCAQNGQAPVRALFSAAVRAFCTRRGERCALRPSVRAFCSDRYGRPSMRASMPVRLW